VSPTSKLVSALGLEMSVLAEGLDLSMTVRMTRRRSASLFFLTVMFCSASFSGVTQKPAGTLMSERSSV